MHIERIEGKYLPLGVIDKERLCNTTRKISKFNLNKIMKSKKPKLEICMLTLIVNNKKKSFYELNEFGACGGRLLRIFETSCTFYKNFV